MISIMSVIEMMKISILIRVLIFVILLQGLINGDDTATSTVAINISVDPRVELMSIIYRLAGKKEYHQPTVQGPYVHDVDKYFSPYKEHPVIKYVVKLPDRCGFDKPMALAVHLADAYTLKERIPFKPIPEGLANSWGGAGLAMRVRL